MGGGGAPGGQGVLCSHSQLLCLSQQPAGENISFASIPSVLRKTSDVIGGTFRANMQMCQLCWKRVQETAMPNSARLKIEEEGLTEPGGS